MGDPTAAEGDGDGVPGPEEWGARYQQNLGSWEDFTARLERLVRDLLEGAGIEAVQIESRTKDVDSFVSKIKRKHGKYADPLKQVTDLAGVRVITYYLEDVERVVACLRSEFEVVVEHSEGSMAASDPDRFGYRSDQYVMRLSSGRRRLPEWQQFGHHCVEVQIRTALQHGWAAIDHKLNYKSEREVPRHLKRRFSRLSALLELADEQFSSLRDAVDDLDAEYDREIAKGHLDLDVDSSSLDVYLVSTGIGERLVLQAIAAGYARADLDPAGVAKDRSDLLRFLQALDVVTIKELDEILKAAEKDWGLETLRRINNQAEKAGFRGPLPAAAHEVVTQLVLIHGRGGDDLVTVYHPAIQAALREVIAERTS